MWTLSLRIVQDYVCWECAGQDADRLYSVQVDSGDMDGFQADTEEDEEDDTDCMIVDVPDVAGDVSEAPVPAPTLCK